jgi:Fe-S cluster biogenesis protein NfuA
MAAPRQEILRVLREVVTPLLLADGAEVYLLDAGDALLKLHLTGRYSGCPGNTLAIRRFIEPAIHAVAPSARVIISSGALVPTGAEKL